MSAFQKKSLRSLAMIFGLIVLVQLVGAAVTFPNIGSWYGKLAMPGWTPPNGTFGPVWTVLYLLLTYVGWRLWENAAGDFRQKLRQPAVRFFFAQLFFNFLWSPLFFGLHALVPALLDILLMILLTVLTMLAVGRMHPRLALLLIPYLAWIGYAASLNVAIIALN